MTLALVPLVAITGLAVFGVAVTAAPALNLLYAQDYEHAVTDNGERLVVEIQHERRLSASTPLDNSQARASLIGQRDITDEAIKAFDARLVETNAQENISPAHLLLVENFQTALRTLHGLRRDIDEGTADLAAIVRRYSEITDVAYMMFAPLTQLSDADLASTSVGIFAISRSREMLAREDAVITGSLVNGKLTAAEHSQILRMIGARRQLHQEAASELISPFREQFNKIFTGEAYQTLFAMEESLSNNTKFGGKLPIDAKVWRFTLDTVLDEMDHAEDGAATALVVKANKVAISAFTRPILAGLLGLLCAAISLTLALRTGRSVVRRLERLRVSALEVAHERLPRAIAALRQPGTPSTFDLALTDMPMIAVGHDEVGQVGHAFGAVQRTAIRAAVDEATLRRGLNDVFLNIARRSQALLHRQLTLLDRMERRTTEPQELEDLFRLDHMATRMRRHAEALVILAGSAPGRGWRHPVPIIDVVRGATSEIEDYTRVTLDRLPEVRILGRAVGDLIHLLAELLENTTSFAPPHTRVRISAEMVGNGLALQVEDRGLGMSDTELAEANSRLADPPPFDPSSSARLGLLVVAKLAARQGITVQLRPSSYGGVTAVVLIAAEHVLMDHSDRTEPIRSTAGAITPAPAQPALQPVPDETTLDITDIAADGLPKRQRRGADTADTLSGSTLGSSSALGNGALGGAGDGDATSRLVVPATPAVEAQPLLARRSRHSLEPAETVASVTAEAETDPAPAPDALAQRVRRTPDPVQPARTPENSPQPRSAEQVRAMMSAFQSGTARGRANATETGTNGASPQDAASDNSTTWEGRA